MRRNFNPIKAVVKASLKVSSIKPRFDEPIFLKMNILDNSLILEKIYSFSDLDTKKNLEKYAQKIKIASCDSMPIMTIKHFQNKNSSFGRFPCVWCMWQEKFKLNMFNRL